MNITQAIEWRLEKNETANQRSREIGNFAHHVMSGLSLVKNSIRISEKREKERNKEDIRSVHITLDIQIKKSGLNISNSKVFSSEAEVRKFRLRR